MLLQLSFLGDAVFELMVREYAISLNIVKLNDLQKFTLGFVTAKRQAYFVEMLMNDKFFTDEEVDLIRCGRNVKTRKCPKNCDMITYKYATAFEILVGFLYKNDRERLDVLFDLIKRM